MSDKKPAVHLLLFAVAALLIAVLWIFGNGRMDRVWEDMQDGMMTFEGGLERTGGTYGVMVPGRG